MKSKEGRRLADSSDDESSEEGCADRHDGEQEHHEDSEQPHKKKRRIRDFTTAERAAIGARLTLARFKRLYAKRYAKAVENAAKFAERVSAVGVRANSLLQVQVHTHGLSLTLVSRGPRRQCLGRALSLSWQNMLSIAHGRTRCISAIADSFAISRQTVRRVTELVGATELEYQALQLVRIRSMLELEVLDFAGDREAWDETTETLCLDAIRDDNAPQQRSGSWSVCVCKILFFWGTATYRQFFHCVVPPLPLPSNSAQNISSALMSHPLMQAIMDFRKFLISKVDNYVSIRESDAHAANDRYHAWKHCQDARDADVAGGATPLTIHNHCYNHQVNLVMVGLALQTTTGLVGNLYCAVRFLKMGGHYLRRSYFKQTQFSSTLPGPPGQST